MGGERNGSLKELEMVLFALAAMVISQGGDS